MNVRVGNTQSQRGQGAFGCEQDQVVRPLTHDLGIPDGLGSVPEDAQWLVVHLPPVAVRAVQDILGPAVRQARNVRQLIVQSGGDQDSSGLESLAVVEQGLEA
jgi:hypothetical protein